VIGSSWLVVDIPGDSANIQLGREHVMSFLVYLIGLAFLAGGYGHLTTQANGCIVFGVGLMGFAVLDAILTVAGRKRGQNVQG
jgi:hypothetical protein